MATANPVADAPDTQPAPAGAGSRILLQNLTRDFGHGRAAVDNVTLEIDAGEFFSLIGPSGCGKTTTLRMISGLEYPTSGAIFLGDDEITDVPAYKRDVHTVFQSYALFPHLNVFQNVAFGLKGNGFSGTAIREKVTRMLELVELQHRAKVKPSALSGGMQQRVALARALVLEPRALLLDEPLGALDLRLRRQMQAALKAIHREVGITFVYVTHDQEEAFAMSDRVGIMRDGELVQVAPPEDVYRRPNSRATAEFVGASNLIEGRIAAVREPGLYEVASEHLDASRVMPGVAGLEVGSSCQVLVRPEVVSVSERPRGECRLSGTVMDGAFLGNHLAVTVDVPGQAPVVAHLHGAVSGRDFEVGAAVHVGWSPADSWVVA